VQYSILKEKIINFFKRYNERQLCLYSYHSKVNQWHNDMVLKYRKNKHSTHLQYFYDQLKFNHEPRLFHFFMIQIDKLS